MADVERHDVVVIGGGPAGVSCALECYDIKLDVVLLEAEARLGGQLADVQNSIRNLPAGRFADGEALRCALEESALLLGNRRRPRCKVEHVDFEGQRLRAGGRQFEFRALVLASGRGRRRLPFAIEGAFGGDVTYQVESSRGRFAGRAVAVVGSGDSATLDALELARAGSRVVLIYRSQLSARPDVLADLRGEPAIETLKGWEVESLAGGERLESITAVRLQTGERRVVSVGGLVLKLGYAPNTELFRGQIDLDAVGAVAVGAELEASRPGVFAAGDVVAGSYLRVATAMGQGVLAARSVARYLYQL